MWNSDIVSQKHFQVLGKVNSVNDAEKKDIKQIVDIL